MSLPRIQLSEFSPATLERFRSACALRDDMESSWRCHADDAFLERDEEHPREYAKARLVLGVLSDLSLMLDEAAERVERERLRAAVSRPYPRTAPCAVECRGDGGQVCALIGPNLAEGVSGYGDTLPDALRALADAIEKETAGCGQEGPPTNA